MHKLIWTPILIKKRKTQLIHTYAKERASCYSQGVESCMGPVTSSLQKREVKKE